ncbi:MAG: DUF4280 domain-containing protein [Alphaproteobacteria bacterium]
MSQWVCMGALVKCSCGAIPTPLTVLPDKRVLVSKRPAANISDSKPFLNILPFGICSSPGNPVVLAMGQAPCTPVTVSPWLPGSPTVIVGGLPALNKTSKTFCVFGGAIEVLFPGQVQTSVP